MNAEKVKSLIGLAQKGRMLEIGRTAVSVLIKRKRASLIILAIGISGLAAVWMATTFALSGKLLEALRNE